MWILNYLCSQGIDPDFRAFSKDDALKKLSSMAAELTGDVDASVVYKILYEREQLGSTAIGKGIAIPHGKIPGLGKICVLVARSSSGVDFEAMDNMPVYVLVLLLAPDDATAGYLKILARISRVLKIDNVVDRIRDAAGASEIKQIIAEAEKHL